MNYLVYINGMSNAHAFREKVCTINGLYLIFNKEFLSINKVAFKVSKHLVCAYLMGNHTFFKDTILLLNSLLISE